MAHNSSPMVSNMKPEEVLEELRTRLYDLGEARTPVVPNPASEVYQLSLYGGTRLRITDIIVELLRNQSHATKQSSHRQDGWTARRDSLLEALRSPWGRCDSNPDNQKCLGGFSGCESCRYSILSIATQINTLVLGFAGTAFAPVAPDWAVQSPENESNDWPPKPDLGVVQNELASTKSKLIEAKEQIECLENKEKNLQESTLKEIQSLQTALENAKKDASNVRQKRDQFKEAYNNLTTTVNNCITILTDKGNSKIRKEIILKLETLPMKHFSKQDEANRRTTLEQKALGYRHQSVKTLMSMEKYKDAEDTAKSILDSRRNRLGKEDEKTQEIFRDYCEILEKMVKREAVEWEYLQLWFDDSLNNKFRDEAGISLAQFNQRHDRMDESAVWYRKVAARRLDRLDVSGAASAALKMVVAQKSFNLSPESVETLTRIWGNADNQLSDNVLFCGQELGTFFVSVGKYKEAKDILLAVWKALEKYRGNEYIDKRITTALSLVSIIPQLPNDDHGDIEELYKSIADQAKEKGDKELSLQYQYQLGCAQLSRENLEDAKKTLKAAWEEAKVAAPAGLGLREMLTIQIGWSYAQAISSQPDQDSDAEKVFQLLWSELLPLSQKKDEPRILAQTIAIVTIGRSYAEFLLATTETYNDEKDQTKRYNAATKVLQSAWNAGRQRVNKLFENRHLSAITDLLAIGDLYGDCLTYLGSSRDAVEVLTEVLNKRNMWTSDTSEIETTSELLKSAIAARGKLREIDAGKKLVDKKFLDNAGKTGKKPAGEAVNLSPSGPNGAHRLREISPAPPVKPKPTPPKVQKQVRKKGLFMYFAGIKE